MAPVGTVITWEMYGAFQNLFHPKIKRIRRRLEQINYKVGRHNVSVLFNKTFNANISSFLHIVSSASNLINITITFIVNGFCLYFHVIFICRPLEQNILLNDKFIFTR